MNDYQKEDEQMGFVINQYIDLKNYIDPNKYLECLREVQNETLKKIRRKKRVKFGIQISVLSVWIGDEFVRNFLRDDRFQTEVIIVWQNNTDKEIKKEIPILIKHFTEEKIPFVIADGSHKPDDYDILLYTSPYLETFPLFGRYNISLDTLICYISYAFNVAKYQQGQFNNVIHNICWKNFALTKADFLLANRYCGIKSSAMVYSGYPKMDTLLDPHSGDRAKWKIVGDRNRVKKIIYAPHHSINEQPFMSTFPNNYRFMLEYAQKHPNTTSWLYKPHPLLGASAVKNGVFSSIDEYEAYCKAWNDLPNGSYIDADYLPWFKTSDAMIFDSGSFIAEYIHVNKPSLYLTREALQVNEFGELIIDAHYQVPGDDLDGIQHFIEYQIDHDTKSELRKSIYDQVFDYFSYNGMTATDFIYHNICESIWGK